MSKLLFPLKDDFAPRPTVFKGGVDRMLQIFNVLRDQNAGGYGGSVVQQIGVKEKKTAWGEPSKNNWTSCSPFTATVIGMLFDKEGRTSGEFEPMYDNGEVPLPSAFYALHNGFHLSSDAKKAAWRKKGWAWANSSAESIQFFNLGYKIEARDLRRGDMVGINWSNRGGHAVFVWDVHLDANGETDAFCFVSSNGYVKSQSPKAYGGAGISIGGCGGEKYFSGKRGESGKPGSLKALLDFSDRDLNIQLANWYVIPRKTAKDVDLSTFKVRPANLIDSKGKKTYVASLSATRLWGIKAPDRGGTSDFDMANMIGYEAPRQPYCMGKAPPMEVHVPDTKPIVHKGPPEKAKEAKPTPAKQHPQRPAEVQDFVELALQKLFDHKWIDKGPGDLTKTNDAETKAAIEDFQTKWKLEPVDKIAGRQTREALRKALQDLADGKPAPHHAPPARKPKIERVSWLGNRVEPGGPMYFAVHGEDIDLITHMKIALKAGGKSASVDVDVELDNGINAKPVLWPKDFTKGAEVTASFSGSTTDGATVSYSSKTPVYVGKVEALPHSDWPWDPKLWTQKMRDIHDDLVATKAPEGPFEKYEVTQYYVKEVSPGDVEVKSAAGEVFGHVSLRSLMQADIEGTMRLDGRVLNITQAGNVYEPKELEVNGVKVIKRKPVAEKFRPERSQWTDVTMRAPWGSGSKMPLIPFRTLAINPKLNGGLYHKKVYIKQLDGMKLPWGEVHNGVCIVGDAGGMRKEHFDLFSGRKSSVLAITSVGGKGGTIVEVKVLGDSEASKAKRK